MTTTELENFRARIVAFQTATCATLSDVIAQTKELDKFLADNPLNGVVPVVPATFTPNVVQGDSKHRYLLNRLGSTTFRLPESTESFEAVATPDDCGLGCRCAAFLIPETARGRELLASAPLYD